MRGFAPVAAIVSAGLLLAGCGVTQGDRAVSGAGIGAAAGLVGGAIIGAPLIGAVVVGGAAGAAVGALTNRNQIDLGGVPWQQQYRN